MKVFFQAIRNIFKIKELRERILLTLSLLLIYRIGCHIPLPGINPAGIDNYLAQLQASGKQENGLLGIISAFTGGAFTKATLLGLGIMPYISASIVLQLMGMAVPYLQKLQNDGESGRKTLNQITRWLTIAICLLQAPSYLVLFQRAIIPTQAAPQAYYSFAHSALFYPIATIILVTGTMFTMWLGEKITDKGIGNGISLVIMVGIISRLPQAVIEEFNYQINLGENGGYIFVLVEVILWLIVILISVLLVKGVRRVTVQYAKKVQASGSAFTRSVTSAVRDYVPLKVNAAGVMPIIFAQAIVLLPVQLGSYFVGNDPEKLSLLNNFGRLDNWWYNITFALLIIIFTFFYTAITIPVNQMADGLKRSGGFVPGIRPGLETSNYLDTILSRITFPGAIFLALIAILPGVVMNFGIQQNFALFFGGTSLIILVGVAVDTIQQINAYLLNHHYDGLMDTGRVKK